MSPKAVSFTFIDAIYGHRLAWEFYGALERGRGLRARKLLERIMGKEISQAADHYLEPWSTIDGLADLRCEIEKAQGPRPATK
jgi:hypothetical protein